MEDVTSISGHATQNAVYAVCGVFTVFMGLMVIARMGTRMFIAKQTGLDDAFIVAAAVFSLMYCIMTYNQAEQGMGLHVWDPSIDTVILLQYLCIFPQKTFRKACYGLIGVTVLWTLWAVFSSMVMCVPIHAFWTTSDFFHDPRCLPRLEMWCVTNPEPSMRRC
jgi:sulfite exporter TauE/SafE